MEKISKRKSAGPRVYDRKRWGGHYGRLPVRDEVPLEEMQSKARDGASHCDLSPVWSCRPWLAAEFEEHFESRFWGRWAVPFLGPPLAKLGEKQHRGRGWLQFGGSPGDPQSGPPFLARVPRGSSGDGGVAVVERACARAPAGKDILAPAGRQGPQLY